MLRWRAPCLMTGMTSTGSTHMVALGVSAIVLAAITSIACATGLGADDDDDVAPAASAAPPRSEAPSSGAPSD